MNTYIHGPSVADFELRENPTLDDSLELPRGFAFAGAHCGIKRNRLDLALLRCTSPEGAAVAGAFTQNAVRAACVRRGASLLPRAGVRAVVINSGNANAMTGEQGERDDARMAACVAAAIHAKPEQVLTNSTGVIGVPLPCERVEAALPDLVASAGTDQGAASAGRTEGVASAGRTQGVAAFARAILTTDTCTKTVLAQVELAGGPVRLFGVAKGSGMIHPNMATTLGYVCTDLDVEAGVLQSLLDTHIQTSFNAISVDGDTSTNDTALVLASAASGVELQDDADHARFSEALRCVLQSLARQVARDGEGATRLLEVEVAQAPTPALAQALARAVCRSSLFKCSVFAGEAEWGRLVAALGQAAAEEGLALEPAGLNVRAQGVTLVRAGRPMTGAAQGEAAGALARSLAGAEVRWEVELGLGDASFTAWGCDLSYDYVRINADEAAQIEVRPDGRVGRNLSLGTYTPKLKHQLLVDGLGYVRRFAGMRVLVLARGSVLHRPMLFGSWVRDLELLLDAGLRPLLVLTDDDASDIADQLDRAFETGLYRLARVGEAPNQIQPRLDRGQPCVLVSPGLEPERVCVLASRLGVGKVLCLDDDAGLHDARGLVERAEPDAAAQGVDQGRLRSVSEIFRALAQAGSRHTLPATHLIDGRMPHALVAELFTDRGVGTLVSHQELPGE